MKHRFLNQCLIFRKNMCCIFLRKRIAYTGENIVWYQLSRQSSKDLLQYDPIWTNRWLAWTISEWTSTQKQWTNLWTNWVDKCRLDQKLNQFLLCNQDILEGYTWSLNYSSSHINSLVKICCSLNMKGKE